uniref:tubulin polymerization-promoting protein family member 3 isoform X2 n=1 Tax=Scatophagus argus TaxID=75038 RepID=UPI001ED8071B|nr:tubulin polymerization-promoting protein family member 3 isoform X2 [Scatophagus argus]
MAESADMEELLTSFKKFAIHGDPKASGKELNGKNWAKLCKDCKITDSKNVTSTDVDIVFSKVKQKTSRIITYEEFLRALEELAPKRFKGQSKEEALESIFKLVEGKEPTNVGVTQETSLKLLHRQTCHSAAMLHNHSLFIKLDDALSAFGHSSGRVQPPVLGHAVLHRWIETPLHIWKRSSRCKTHNELLTNKCRSQIHVLLNFSFRKMHK